MSIESELSDSGLLKLENQLCFTLYSASRKMTSAYRPLLAELGITFPQYLVMMVMWEANVDAQCAEQGVRVGELSAKLQLDNGTLTPLLKRMEHQGLLSRARDVDDERVVRIRLTHEGTELKALAMVIPQKMMCESGLSVDKLQQIHNELSDVLGKVPGLGV